MLSGMIYVDSQKTYQAFPTNKHWQLAFKKVHSNRSIALINFTFNMKNSRKFVGDAIPLKEPDFTLERITLNFRFNIW